MTKLGEVDTNDMAEVARLKNEGWGDREAAKKVCIPIGLVKQVYARFYIKGTEIDPHLVAAIREKLININNAAGDMCRYLITAKPSSRTATFLSLNSLLRRSVASILRDKQGMAYKLTAEMLGVKETDITKVKITPPVVKERTLFDTPCTKEVPAEPEPKPKPVALTCATSELPKASAQPFVDAEYGAAPIPAEPDMALPLRKNLAKCPYLRQFPEIMRRRDAGESFEKIAKDLVLKLSSLKSCYHKYRLTIDETFLDHFTRDVDGKLKAMLRLDRTSMSDLLAHRKAAFNMASPEVRTDTLFVLKVKIRIQAYAAAILFGCEETEMDSVWNRVQTRRKNISDDIMPETPWLLLPLPKMAAYPVTVESIPSSEEITKKFEQEIKPPVPVSAPVTAPSSVPEVPSSPLSAQVEASVPVKVPLCTICQKTQVAVLGDRCPACIEEQNRIKAQRMALMLQAGKRPKPNTTPVMKPAPKSQVAAVAVATGVEAATRDVIKAQDALSVAMVLQANEELGDRNTVLEAQNERLKKDNAQLVKENAGFKSDLAKAATNVAFYRNECEAATKARGELTKALLAVKNACNIPS